MRATFTPGTYTPKAWRVTTVTLTVNRRRHTFDVAYEYDEDCGFWVDMVKIAGAWWDAQEVLSIDMQAALDKQLKAEFEAERLAA